MRPPPVLASAPGWGAGAGAGAMQSPPLPHRTIVIAGLVSGAFAKGLTQRGLPERYLDSVGGAVILQR